MESGALGCEIILKGKLRSDRARYEKVTDGYIPKAGEPALRYVKRAVIHVKQKKGTFGVAVTIVPPDAKFPDKIDLSNLPILEYPEEEIVLPEGVEPDIIEVVTIEGETTQEPDNNVEPTTALDSQETQNNISELEKQTDNVESVEVPTDTIQPGVGGQGETETETTTEKLVEEKTETDLRNDANEQQVETPVESKEVLDKSENSENITEE
jgi:small subunit ribosomal protein S3